MNPMDAIVYNLEMKKVGAESQRFGDVQLQETEKLVRLPTELYYCLEEAVQRMGMDHLQEILALMVDRDVVAVNLALHFKAKHIRFTLEDIPLEDPSHE